MHAPGSTIDALAIASLAIALACPIGGCGAKTGLLVPCEVPLEPVPATIVLVFDHSTGMLLPGSGSHPNSWDLARISVESAIEPYDAIAATGLFIFPIFSPPNTPQVCVVNDALQVSPGLAMLESVREQLTAIGDPGGAVPAHAALERVRPIILHSSRLDGPRLLVFASSGFANCDASPPPDPCACDDPRECIDPVACPTLARVEATLRYLAAAGAPTVVVGDVADVPLGIAALDRLAVAGGLPRVGGEHEFQNSRNTGEVSSAIDAYLGPRIWCHVALPHSLDPRSHWNLVRRQSGESIPPDPSRTMGWDWLTPSTIQVFGTPCTAIATRRERLVMVSSESRCEASVVVPVDAGR